MKFWTFKRHLYPIVAIAAGIFIMIFGLLAAKSKAGPYYILAVYLLLFVFGCHRTCIRILPGALLTGGIFFGIFYAITGQITSATSMAVRFIAVFLAMVPGMTTSTVAMTRSLSAVHTPRSITLGCLIVMSFMPLLREETHRVREAMRVRGAGSLWNPKIFYRALLIPLVMRLVNISDTLALSVETRGFSLRKVPYTIYKREAFAVSDVIFSILLVIIGVGAVIL